VSWSALNTTGRVGNGQGDSVVSAGDGGRARSLRENAPTESGYA